MGTPEFVAPEQAAGNVRDIDARTDLYSVGAMMFSLITGQFVHKGRSGMEQMIFAATRPARSLFDVWANAPSALANVIDIALSFDKTKRWTNAAEMQRAITNASATLKDDIGFDSTMVPIAGAAVQRITGASGTLILGKK